MSRPDRLKMLDSLSPTEKARILALAFNRRIPKEACKHRSYNVARDVIIQLPLIEGCLRGITEETISTRVKKLIYCANPCCEKVFVMEVKKRDRAA